MSDPFKVVRDFELALCQYTGAPYAVTTTSCTAALMLAVAWHLRDIGWTYVDDPRRDIEIPKRTYVSVPQAIIHAGGRPRFRDEDWLGCYQLKPLPVWDSARWFSEGMYATQTSGYRQNTRDYIRREEGTNDGQMLCVSFHWAKTLGIQQGGAILHDDPEADKWLRQARFDGRIEGVTPREQAELYGFKVLGWHCYMSPEVAAEGLVRLHHLPRYNPPLPNDDYPDLSQMDIFK